MSVVDGRYLSVESFKAWDRDEIDVHDDLISEAILAAEQELDNQLSRRVAVAGEASSRVYRPQSLGFVQIDDCTTVTAVLNNGATVAASAYQLEPLNALSAAGESVPYDSIRLLSGSWFCDGQRATVAVTATWGWASIPPGLLEACKIVTSDTLNNRNVRSGIVALTEGAGISARENSTVQKVIRAYRGHRSWGIA